MRSRIGCPRSPRAIRLAALADHAFLLAVPMWIVASVTALAGHSLFPDLIDFRVLMALPVSRRLFSTKLARWLFSPASSAGPPRGAAALAAADVGRPLGRTGVAAAIDDARGGGTARVGVLRAAMTAVHGLVVLAAPRGRQVAVSALRSVTLGLLVVSLPMVLRLPGQRARSPAGRLALRCSPGVVRRGRALAVRRRRHRS